MAIKNNKNEIKDNDMGDEYEINDEVECPYCSHSPIYFRDCTNLCEEGKFRRSRHLQNQILKYNYPKDSNPQLSIYDILEPETREEIKTAE